MSTRLFGPAGKKFGDAAINYSSDTIKVSLIDLSVTDTAVKAITGATNATPIVITSNSHGFSNGDIVVIQGVGGNTAANGTWKIANVATNTFELTTTTNEALNAVGNGAYTSGGRVIDTTLATNLSDCDAGINSTATLASKSDTLGVFTAADPTFSSVANGSTSHAMITYDNQSGSAATSPLILFNDGTHQVIVNRAVSTSDTSVSVEPLESAITNPTTFIFSNAQSVTTNATVNQFARSIGIASAGGAVAIGHTADVVSTASPNFPISGNGGNITVNIDTAKNKLFALIGT